jgi:hypothetical protein
LTGFCLEVRLMRIPTNIERFRNSGRPHGGDDYALIAVMSGWMPMMFMTRVRL